MWNDLTVSRRVPGLIALTGADRVDPDDADGANPDEGAGGDSQSLDDDAPLGDPEDDDADTRQASDDGTEEHDDDDDDDDTRYDGLPADEQIKRLRAALKKNKRKLSKRSPVYQRVQEVLAREGGTLDDLVLTRRQYRDLTEKLRTSPKLRALLDAGGEDATDRRPAARGTDRRPADDEEFQFDDSPEALGFDAKASHANKTLAAAVRGAKLAEHRYNKLVARLDGLDPDAIKRRVDGLEEHTRTQSRQSIEREWNGAVSAAEAHITDQNPKRQAGLRTMFRDGMRMAMLSYGGKEPPTRFVKHHFELLQIKPAATRNATTAAARSTQQAAQRVTQLQRQPSQTGRPAPANNKRKTMADVHRSVRNAGGAQVR